MNFIRRERKPYYFYLFNGSLNRMNNMKDPESRTGETERRKQRQNATINLYYPVGVDGRKQPRCLIVLRSITRRPGQKGQM